MLIARNIALIVVAFWCGVNAMAQSQESPPQAPQIQTEQQPDSAAKSQSQSEQDTRPTNQIPPPDQNIQAENSHRNAEGNADKRAEETREYWPFLILGARLKITDSLLAIFTFCLVVVGAVQGFFLYRTDQATQKAANAAQKSAEAVVGQLRAYIGINSGSVTHATVDNMPGLHVHVELKNSGSTPAFDFTTWIKILVADKDGPAPFTEPIPVAERTGTSIVTGGTSVNINWYGVWAPGDLEKVRAGTKAIFVWGGCDYRDAFQNPRRFIFRDMMSGREDAANGWALKPHPMGYEGN